MISNNLILLIRTYLQNLKKYINLQKEEFLQECDYLDISVLNEIPERWWKEGFLIENYSLSEFFTNFLYKMEYKRNPAQQFIVLSKTITLDLARLFDPFSFFISSLIDYSMKNQV